MIALDKNADHGTWQRIDYRSGKAAIIRRTAMSYDQLMQVVTEQAMQRAMVQITKARRLSPGISARSPG